MFSRAVFVNGFSCFVEYRICCLSEYKSIMFCVFLMINLTKYYAGSIFSCFLFLFAYYWNYKYIYCQQGIFEWIQNSLSAKAWSYISWPPVWKDIPISWNKWDILYKWNICQYSQFHIFFSLSFVLSFGVIQPKVTTVNVGEDKV